MLYSGGGWANETHMIWPHCNKMHEGQDNLARQELKGLWTRAALAIFCSVSKLPLGLRNICLRGLDLSMLLVGWFRLCLCRCFLKVVQMCSPLPGLHDMTYHSRRKKLLGFLDFSWWRGEIAVHGAAGRNLTEICTSLSSLLSCWSHLESKDRQLCRCSCNC